MKDDFYKSLDTPSEGVFKDKGSKFLAFAFPLNNEAEVKGIILNLKKKYHDARHHCYAFKIGLGEDIYRYNDDGEPSGTAGRPIFGQILSNQLSDILIVVVRYFGGTLLGTSGLINAYKNAASDCIKNAKIIDRVIKKALKIDFSYELMSKVMRIVKEESLEITNQDFLERCNLTLNIRLNDYERIHKRYQDVYGVEIQ